VGARWRVIAKTIGASAIYSRRTAVGRDSFRAVFDNPAPMVACVVADGEAQAGPPASAWPSNVIVRTTP
jgi:hypothetical protein